MRGKTNKQIAVNALGGTERTIKAHRQRVMEKMEARSVAELVSLAERVGLLGDTSEADRRSKFSTVFELLLSYGTIGKFATRGIPRISWMLKPPALRGSTGSQFLQSIAGL